MLKLFTNTDNQIIAFSDGTLMLDETCCCRICDLCSNTPIQITVEFLSDPSSTPSGWVGSWTLDYYSPCCYILTAGLPNTCYKMTACIINSGDALFGVGSYQLHIQSFYPNGLAHDDTHYEGCTATIIIDPHSDDCLVNGNGITDSTGYGPSTGTNPVDWVNTAFPTFFHQINLTSV